MSRPSISRLLLLCGAVTWAIAAPARAEVLYNGIELPKEWPPRYNAIPTREPMPVPYLDRIPSVIPIDVGRQLFIDDFLIEPSTLKRSYHSAEYFAANPVIKPDKPWEGESLAGRQASPTAMVFSDGVWYDPREKIYKAWYMGGSGRSTCYATSDDGIHWTKPQLDVVPGTNIVSTHGRDSSTVWFDQFETDPQRRYKMFLYERPFDGAQMSLYFSPDGIHWSDLITRSGPTDDRCSAFYNPFRKVWVYSIKESRFGRRRRYFESPDVIKGTQWTKETAPLWVGADRLDRWWDEYKIQPQLYNLDAAAYESVMLGMFVIWPGPGGNGRPKPNQLYVGFSRDGFHWYRPSREPFVPVSATKGDWNWGNVQSAGGCCLVVGDRLRFYVSGRAGIPGGTKADSGESTTGLATLRRDGFVSMDAPAAGGDVITRPIRFDGQYLFVNVDAPQGELRVEVLDENRKPLEPWTLANSVPSAADSTLQRVRWNGGADDLKAVSGKPVRFRFQIKNGKLYSFWVTPDESGASHGYVAAGGPGFTGPLDTVGDKAQGEKSK